MINLLDNYAMKYRNLRFQPKISDLSLPYSVKIVTFLDVKKVWLFGYVTLFGYYVTISEIGGFVIEGMNSNISNQFF